MKRILPTLFLALAALTLAACGGSDDDSSGDDRVDAIAEAFSRMGAPDDEARCVAEKLPADTTPEQVTVYVEAVIDADDPNAIGDADLDLAIAIGEAASECTG